MASFEHEGVLPMPPNADDPVAAGQSADPATMIPSAGADPVRVVVHGMLAIYLSPVILIVCLIGAASILAGKAARMTVKVGDRLTRWNGSRPARMVHLGEDKNGPRLIQRRHRSGSAR
jgi:hypothetical protein